LEDRLGIHSFRVQRELTIRHPQSNHLPPKNKYSSSDNWWFKSKLHKEKMYDRFEEVTFLCVRLKITLIEIPESLEDESGFESLLLLWLSFKRFQNSLILSSSWRWIEVRLLKTIKSILLSKRGNILKRSLHSDWDHIMIDFLSHKFVINNNCRSYMKK